MSFPNTKHSSGQESRKMFTVNLLRDSRVAPLSLDGEDPNRGGNKPAGFREIFITAMLIGSVIPNSLWATKRNLCGSCIKLWNLVVVYVRTSLLLFYFLYQGYFWPSVVMQISFGAQIVLGYVFSWFFIIMENKINHSLNQLFFLSSIWSSGERENRSFVKIKLFLVAVVVGAFTWTASEFLYFAAWTPQLERLKPLLSFTEDAEFIYYFNWMVNFSFILSYYSGAATLYILTLLCVLSYRSCGKLLKRYGRALEKEARERPLTQETISKRQSQIREIFSCLRDVDQSFNGCVLMLYGIVMNDIFSAISGGYSSLRKSHGSIEYVLFLILKALVSLTIFFYITYGGSSVADEKLALQKRMIRISSLFMKYSPSTQTALAFESLYSTIKYADARATILDLFDIKQDLIPAAVGFYFTYGVYMYQFVSSPIH